MDTQTNQQKKTETDKQSIHIDNVDEIKKFQSFTLLFWTETKLVFQIGLRFEEDDLIREGKRDWGRHLWINIV